VNIGTLKSS